MNRKVIWSMALLATLVTVSLMLGVLQATSVEHLLLLAENNLMWMVFFLRLYLGANLFIARALTFLTIAGGCILFYMSLGWMLCMAFEGKSKGK